MVKITGVGKPKEIFKMSNSVRAEVRRGMLIFCQVFCILQSQRTEAKRKSVSELFSKGNFSIIREFGFQD